MAVSPLFDIYDPYGEIRDGFQIGPPNPEDELLGILPGRRPQVSDLMPEEEKANLLRQLANAGASGLSGFGWLLDTPGAMVRGGLSGGLGKAVSALWEDSEQRVSGRDLARQYGMAGEDDNWANFSGSLLLETALDPLSYIGIGLLGRGAKTLAARSAEKAGLMAGDIGLLAKRAGKGRAQFLRESTPQTLIDMADDQAEALARWNEYAGTGASELLDKPLARMNRVSIPGLRVGAVDLFGSQVGDTMAKLSDRLGSAAMASPLLGPALRTTQAMFDPRVMGFTDETGQYIGRRLTEGERTARLRAQREIADASVDAAMDLEDGVFRDPRFAEAVGNFMEGQFNRIPPEMLRHIQSPAGQKYLSWMRSQLDDALVRSDELGIPLEYTTLPNAIDYFPRQQAIVDNPRYAPGYAPKQIRGRQGTAIAGVGDGATAARKDYTRSFPRWVLDKMNQDQRLQDELRRLPNASDGFSPDVAHVIDGWLTTNAIQFTDPFAWARTGKDAAADATRVQRLYVDLADSLRRTPLQAAEQQVPKFGSSINDFNTYLLNRARNESHGNVLLDILADRDQLLRNSGDILSQAADDVPGGLGLGATDALKSLGFDAEKGAAALAQRMGVPVEDLANLSYSKQFIDKLNERIYKARTPREAEGLLRLAQNFTDSFKTLALASVARHVRDAYSGSFAGATQGAFNLFDWLAGAGAAGGRYGGLVQQLRGTAKYPQNWTDDQILRKFLKDAGAMGISTGTVADDLGRGASNLGLNEPFPGAGGGLFRNLLNKNWRDWRTYSPFSVRGTAGNPNPILDLSDRAASFTDAGNRLGTYITRIRKGDAPEAAKAVADLTQVLYGPENFTALERDVFSRVFPFYRYTKGITPFIAKELVERPYGMTGQSIRAINRAAEPSEDQFIPEYLRQSAAIPVDSDSLFGVKTPGVQRFLTNIDLPHESVLNLFTPGLGNTFAARLGDTVMKTGSNILGQSNPLIKGPLEYILNRQFYSGRQLSDLYSMLEHDIGAWGRPLEQVVVNAPGGSRLLGLLRQARDERISPAERAAKLFFNALTGLKFQDVDQDKTVRLAARTTLNQLLDQAPGMSTYENLFIKPADLAQLSPQEQRQYLLYRVLQSEAAKRARLKKQAEEDPMAVLGVG